MSTPWLTVFLLACGAETEPAPPPVVEAPPPPAPEPVPVPRTFPVVVDAHQQIGEGPGAPANKPTLVARPGTDRIELVIDQLATWCAPPPTFTAAAKGEFLELTLVRPDPVSRCFATHHVEAHVDLPGRHGVRRVVLLNPEGMTIVESPMTSGR